MGTAAVSFPQAQIRLLCTQLDIGGVCVGVVVVVKYQARRPSFVFEPDSQPILKETSKKQQQNFHHFCFFFVFCFYLPFGVPAGAASCGLYIISTLTLCIHISGTCLTQQFTVTQTVHSMIRHHIYRGK